MAIKATESNARGGTIADVFTTLEESADITPLPPRFATVKKEVLRDMGVMSDVLELAWKGVLNVLEPRAIPRFSYREVENGLSECQRDAIRKTRVEALKWKRQTKDYIAANPVKDNIQVYELYNSKSHINAPSANFITPISYFDRLRIRTPGDRLFTLGPHIDGGSVERWEDYTFRRVWTNILCDGQNGWKTFDPFDAIWRVNARQDKYNAPNQCTIFRCWELNLEGSKFPGSIPGKAQELNDFTHPHLRLAETMTSVPRIEPRDQVYWHCDTVHAVEGEYNGRDDSSALYIPAVSLYLKNVSYLCNQRINFIHGLPAPDFPVGEGESEFLGRATLQDIALPHGYRAMGFEPFVARSATTCGRSK